jgi:hypothetical protein
MTQRYSLRLNTKSRRRPRNTEEADDQVGSTTTSTSASTSSTGGEGHKPLADEMEAVSDSGTVDPRPTTPTPTPVASSSAINISASATTTIPGYRILKGAPETWEEIQASRKRVEARCITEAKRIQREQIVRGFEAELHELGTRILALRHECDVQVEKVRRRWERDWAIERGKVAVVVEDGQKILVAGPDTNSEMVNKIEYTHTVISALTTNNDDHQQWRWSSQSAAPARSRAKSGLQPPPLRKVYQQHLLQWRQSHMGTSPLSGMVGSSRQSSRRLELEVTEEVEDHERGPPPGETPIQGPRWKSPSRSHHPQPLRRQAAQLMTIPTSSHGSHRNTYDKAVLDLETHFGGTDGDNDLEMDG